MRWGYLIPRLLIAFLFWGTFHFGFDPVLKKTAHFSAELLMDSKVDLYVLETEFFPPEIKIEKVAIADSSNPGFNLLEFDSMKLKLEGKPLLRRSYIIKEASLTGLQFGTVRKETGPHDSEIDFSLPTIKVDGFDFSFNLKTDDWMSGLTGRIKDAIDPNQLESVQLARKKQLDWKNRFSKQKETLELLKKQLEQLQSQVKGAKGNALEKLQVYHDTAMNAKQLRKEIKRIRDELNQLPKLARSDYAAIIQAGKKDQQNLKDKTQILKLDPKAISQSLLGEELEKKIQQTMNYLSWLKENLSDKMDIPEPERFRGTEIDFAKNEALPKYLCRKMFLSGQSEISGQQFEFTGILKNLTSEPQLHKKPMTIEVEGIGEDDFLAKATIDLTRKTPAYKLHFQYHQNHPPTLHLGKGSELAFDLSADRTDLESLIEIKNGKLNGQIQLSQSPCRIELVSSETEDKNFSVAQTLQRILGKIDSLNTQLDLGGTLDRPEWSVTSNLGEYLSEGMSDIFAEEFEKQKAQMAQVINNNMIKELKVFESLLKGESSQLTAMLNLQENDAQKLIQKIAGGKSFKFNSLLRR